MPLPKNPYPDLTDAQVREQLQWLETIMTRSKVATWKLHRPSMKMFINSALAELLGQSWQREQSYPFELLVEAMHAECRHSAMAVMQQLWAGDLEHADVIFRVTAAHGQARTIRDTVSVISHDRQGQAEWLTGVWIDITDTVMAHHRLERIASTVPGVIYQFSMYPDGRMCFPYASAGIKAIYGVDADVVSTDGSAVFDAIHPADRERVRSSIQQSAESLQPWFCEYRIVRGEQTRWVAGNAMPELDAEGVYHWFGQIVDTTLDKQRELELEESRITLKRAQEIAELGYWKANFATGELYWSDKIYEIFGLDKDTVKPSISLFQQAVHPDDLALVLASEQQAKKFGTHDVVHRIVRTDGSVRWVHELADYNQYIHEDILIGTVRDITEQKIYEQELERLSITDELTGVYNRRYFMQQLEQLVVRFTPSTQAVVAIFDIDYFKQINDNYGHAEGDAVLRRLAQFMQQQLRPGDIFARTGGEEFGLLLHRTNAADAKRRLNAIRILVNELEFVPSTGTEQPYRVSATIGLTNVHVDDDKDSVLYRADHALYFGKNKGRNCVIWADDEADADVG